MSLDFRAFGAKFQDLGWLMSPGWDHFAWWRRGFYLYLPDKTLIVLNRLWSW